MRKAAEAEAAFKALGKTSGDVTASQVAGEEKLTAARKAEIDTLKAERSQVNTSAEAWKRYNMQALYGGRSDMGAHLSDMEKELQYETLLNRQRWLGFSSPQQAYGWRSQEYQQRLLMNRAEFAGYFSADQYLAYLQKQITLWQGLNSSMRDRAALFRENADSALAYYNSLQGTHKSLGQLGTNLDLSGLAAFSAAVNAVPDQNVTRLSVDDQQGMAAIAKFDTALNSVPDSKTIFLNVVRGAKAVLPTDQSITQVVNEVQGKTVRPPADQRITEVVNQVQGKTVRPPSEQTVSELVNAVLSAPREISTRYRVDDAAARSELVRIAEEIHQIPPRVDITAGFDDAKARAEMQAFMAFAAAHRSFGVTEDVSYLYTGRAGGGGGPPPLAVAPGGGGGSKLPPVAVPTAAAGGENPNNAAAVAAALAAALKQQAGAAKADALALHEAAAATSDLSGKTSAQIVALIQQKVAAGASATEINALSGALDAVRLQAAAADTEVTATGGTLGKLGATAVFTEKGFAGLGTRFLLLGGAAGSVGILHLAFDAILETLLIMVPALITLAAGLGAFGLAAVGTAQDIYGQMKNILTVSNALNTTVPPLTGALQKLTDAVRPQVMVLFGEGLMFLNSQTGLLQKLALATGQVLDRFGARFLVDLQQSGGALQKFLAVGVHDLQGLGAIIVNITHFFGGLLLAAAKTHLAEDLLGIAVVLSKILALAGDLLHNPVAQWFAALAIGAHGAWLWLGLFGTAVLAPIRSIALLVGGIREANSALGLLGANASRMDRFKATLTDVGNGFAALPGRIGLFRNSADAATASVGKGAVAIDEEAAAMSGLAAGGGKAEGAMAGLAGGLGRGGLVGIAILAVAAIGLVVTKLALMSDQTQTWLNKLTDVQQHASIFQVVGVTVQQLAAVTTQLAVAQKTGQGNASELASAQRNLSDQLGLETSRVGIIAHRYGTDFVGALELLNASGVKTSDLFSRQGKIWAVDQVLVQALIQSYKAMGQQAGLIGADLNVLNVTASDQFKQMQSLNKAWDTFQQAVAAPYSGVLTLAQGMAQFNTDAKAAGAAMLGLNAPSVKLQQDFQSNYSSVQQLFDAFRAAQSLNGGAGDFVKFVKDAVAALIPLAGQNKAAAAEISQLAQEAGGPATTSLSALAKWAGNVKDPMGQLYKQSMNATVATADLNHDAQLLANTLQNDLNPAMAKALFDAKGGQKPFEDMAVALQKNGANSRQFAAAARNVATELLAVDGNSAQAKAQFVGYAEALGLSSKQAGALWRSLTTGRGAIDTSSKGIQGLRLGLGQTYESLAKLGTPGLWGQIEHGFLSFGNAWKSTLTGIFSAWKNVWDAVMSLFKGVIALLEGHWSQAWNDLVSAVRHIGSALLDAVRAIFTPIANAGKQIWDALPASWRSALTGAVRTAGGALETAWKAVTGALVTAWNAVWANVVAPVTRGFDAVRNWITGNFVNWFSSTLPHAFNTAWSTVFTNIVGPVSKAFDAVKSWITANFDAWWKTHGSALESVWNGLWATLKGAALSVWSGIVQVVKAGFALVAGVFTGGSGTITGVMKVFWGGIEGIFKQGWDVVSNLVKAGWAVGAGLFKANVALITGIVKVFWDNLAAVGKIFWASLQALVKVGWDTVVVSFKVATAVITGIAKVFWDTLVTVAKIFWASLTALVKIAWDTIVVIFNVFLDLITGHWKTAWTDVKAYGVQVWNAIRVFLSQTWNAIRTDAGQVWNAIRVTLEQIWNAMKVAAGQVWNAIRVFMQQTWNAVKNEAVQVWNAIRTSLEQIWNALKSAAGSFWNNIRTGFTNLWNAVRNDTIGTWNALRNGLDQIWNTIKGTAASFWGTLKRGFSDVVSALSATWNRLVSIFRNPVNFLIGTVYDNGIARLWNDVAKFIPGIPQLPHINTIASGGEIPMAAGGRGSGFRGSVPGPGSHDNYPAVLMGGEYVLRQPARMAAERDFGRGFMDWLNHYDQWSGSGSRGTAASQRHAAGGPAYAPGMAVTAYAFGGYVNPVPPGVRPERIDQGVDFAGTGPVRAMGPASIIETGGGGWPGGPFMSYHLLGGQLAGTNVYVAENIRPTVHPGQTVQAGATIANMFNGGTGIEMGFASPSGTGTLAQLTGGYTEGEVTSAGKLFDELLVSLGAPAAPNIGAAAHGTLPTSATTGKFGVAGNPFGAIVNFFKSVGGTLGGALTTITGPLGRLLSGALHDVLNLFDGAVDVGKIVSALVTGNGTAISNALGDLVSRAKFPAGGELLKWITGIPEFLISHLAPFAASKGPPALAAATVTTSFGGGTFSGTPGHGSVPANAAAIASYLEAHGLSKVATAGILGNIEQESGGNPMAGTNPPGRGLIQILGDPGGSLPSELLRTMQYILANGSVADINAHSQTPTSAALWFSDKYERPNPAQANNANRVGSAIASSRAGYAAGGPAGGPYTVRPGDTLSRIAAMYGTTWQELFRGNRAVIGPNPNLIRPGERLSIPGFAPTRAASRALAEWAGHRTAANLNAMARAGRRANEPVRTDIEVLAAESRQNDWFDLRSDVPLALADARRYLATGGPVGLPYTPDADNYSWHQFYTVRSGDWLAKIAAAHGTSWEELYEANRNVVGANPNMIRPGEVLLVPGGTPAGGGTPPPKPPPKPPPGPRPVTGTVGPVQLPVLPGPAGSVTLGGLPSFNLEPFATMGGPASGFSPAGAGSMGFGSGGGVLMYAAGGDAETISMPTLADVSGLFGILVPGQNGFVPVPFPELPGRVASASRAASPSRSLSEAGAASSRIGVNISGDMVINNPRPEKPSDSIARSNQRLAVLAGRGA